ncbi:unnamed protein product [Mytilus edulis]|uniref:Ig-like domain-containing protein n=1 Tax=Mytilus edulis TaxID=6550 RepID=A0A8S3RWD7_MYTED|nr:unnamed protein product [Mytilus edulis]
MSDTSRLIKESRRIVDASNDVNLNSGTLLNMILEIVTGIDSTMRRMETSMEKRPGYFVNGNQILVKEYTSVELVCPLSLNQSENVSLSWYYEESTPIAIQHTVNPAFKFKYKINDASNEEKYSLTIFNYSKSDQGKYICEGIINSEHKFEIFTTYLCSNTQSFQYENQNNDPVVPEYSEITESVHYQSAELRNNSLERNNASISTYSRNTTSAHYHTIGSWNRSNETANELYNASNDSTNNSMERNTNAVVHQYVNTNIGNTYEQLKNPTNDFHTYEDINVD